MVFLICDFFLLPVPLLAAILFSLSLSLLSRFILSFSIFAASLNVSGRPHAIAPLIKPKPYLFTMDINRRSAGKTIPTVDVNAFIENANYTPKSFLQTLFRGCANNAGNRESVSKSRLKDDDMIVDFDWFARFMIILLVSDRIRLLVFVVFDLIGVDQTKEVSGLFYFTLYPLFQSNQ